MQGSVGVPPGRIRVTGQLICASAADAAIVDQYLPEHIRLSRAEAGCRQFNVVVTDDPLIWRLDEEFDDMAAFEAHQSRTRASLWFAMTTHMTRNFSILET